MNYSSTRHSVLRSLLLRYLVTGDLLYYSYDIASRNGSQWFCSLREAVVPAASVCVN